MYDDDELERLRNLTPARALRARYTLKARLTSAGSTSGIVAERARLGLATRPTGGYQGGGGDVVRQELAWLIGLCKDLSEVEDACCSIRYGGTGERVSYERIVRVGDLRDGDGEEVVDVRPRNLDGELLPGWVRVRGTRELLPTYLDVGGTLGLTASQARVHLNAAREKIATAIQWRLMMATQQSRYT